MLAGSIALTACAERQARSRILRSVAAGGRRGLFEGSIRPGAGAGPGPGRRGAEGDEDLRLLAVHVAARGADSVHGFAQEPEGAVAERHQICAQRIDGPIGGAAAQRLGVATGLVGRVLGEIGASEPGAALVEEGGKLLQIIDEIGEVRSGDDGVDAALNCAVGFAEVPERGDGVPLQLDRKSVV